MQGNTAAVRLGTEGADLDGGAMASNQSGHSKARKKRSICGFAENTHVRRSVGMIVTRKKTVSIRRNGVLCLVFTGV